MKLYIFLEKNILLYDIKKDDLLYELIYIISNTLEKKNIKK
jgi:hypothetical protein